MPTTAAHIIVTGSRDAIEDADWSFVFRTLGLGTDQVLSITTGACPTGIDAIATAWGQHNNKVVHEFPADWATHKKAAGPIRNRQMIRETIRRYKHDNIVVLAFTNKPLENSRGTANCMKEADAAGLTTHHFRTDLQAHQF